MGERALVQFFCMNPKHRAPDAQRSDHLTVADGAWAYCPKDSQLADHHWEPTGGIAVAEIARFAKRHEGEHQIGNKSAT